MNCFSKWRFQNGDKNDTMLGNLGFTSSSPPSLSLVNKVTLSKDGNGSQPKVLWMKWETSKRNVKWSFKIDFSEWSSISTFACKEQQRRSPVQQWDHPSMRGYCQREEWVLPNQLLSSEWRRWALIGMRRCRENLLMALIRDLQLVELYCRMS